MKGGKTNNNMEEDFEEFEEDFEDDEDFEEPEPPKRAEPGRMLAEPRRAVPIKAEQKPAKSVAKPVEKEKYLSLPVPQIEPSSQRTEEKVREEKKIEPRAQEPQITAEDLIAVIQNHEQRIIGLESALFRLRGAI